MYQRGEVHLLEHVEVVVRGRTVGTKRNIDAKLHSANNTSKAAAQLHVARRIVHKRNAAFGHDPEVVIGTPHAMRRVSAVVENPRVREIRNRRLPVPRDALLVLTPRLAAVEVKPALELLVGLGESTAERLVRQILGVDADIHIDVALHIVVHPSVPIARCGDALLKASRYDRKPRHAHSRPHAKLAKCVSVIVVVHVGDACRAAGKHLHRTPDSTGVDILVSHLGLNREYRLGEPALERQSPAKSANKRHRRMAVAVYEPRHNEMSAKVGLALSPAAEAAGRDLFDSSRHGIDDDIAAAHLAPGQKHVAVLEHLNHTLTSSTALSIISGMNIGRACSAPGIIRSFAPLNTSSRNVAFSGRTIPSCSL